MFVSTSWSAVQQEKATLTCGIRRIVVQSCLCYPESRLSSSTRCYTSRPHKYKRRVCVEIRLAKSDIFAYCLCGRRVSQLTARRFSSRASSFPPHNVHPVTIHHNSQQQYHTAAAYARMRSPRSQLTDQPSMPAQTFPHPSPTAGTSIRARPHTESLRRRNISNHPLRPPSLRGIAPSAAEPTAQATRLLREVEKRHKAEALFPQGWSGRGLGRSSRRVRVWCTGLYSKNMNGKKKGKNKGPGQGSWVAGCDVRGRGGPCVE